MIELLVSQWKLVLIGLLLAAVSFQTHRLSNAEDKIVEVSTRFQLAKDAAEAETKKAQDTSTQTVKEINDAIPKLVAAAQANALENYQRRYGRLARPISATDSGDRPSLGDGIHADGLRSDPAANSASAIQTGIPEGAASAASGVDACDPRFINEAAQAAAIMRGIDVWLDNNGFEREKRNDNEAETTEPH